MKPSRLKERSGIEAGKSGGSQLYDFSTQLVIGLVLLPTYDLISVPRGQSTSLHMPSDHHDLLYHEHQPRHTQRKS